MLFNLIHNAIRHTPADGSVTVAAESNDKYVEIEVADTGEGISAEVRERAFEPFFRGGTGGARSGGGTGLGLTICQANRRSSRWPYLVCRVSTRIPGTVQPSPRLGVSDQ